MPETTTATGDSSQTSQTTTQQSGQTGSQTTGQTTQDGQTTQTTQSTQSGWGDNWRETYAGQDPKVLAQLQRFPSPKALIDAHFSAQQKIRSGELRAPLGENATTEEVAAYRQQNGIPEKPEGYFEKLPDGLVIGDEDKPLFNSFAEGLHKLNAPPAIAQYAVKWYNDLQEQQAAKVSENDTAHKQGVEDELRTEWGGDYRSNINHIQGFLSKAPEGVADLLMNARGSDGRAILNNPQVVRWLAQVAREDNPAGIIVPAGGDTGATIDAELKNLEGMMGNQQSEYWKGPKADQLQARYRTLVDARERQRQRA